VKFGQIPQVQPVLGAISAAVIAIVIVAAIRFARTSIRDGFSVMIAVLALALSVVLPSITRFPPELIILALAALAGASRVFRPRNVITLPAMIWLTLPAFPREILTMFGFFLRVGATLFGSGYVLISYLRAGLVEQRGWMTDQQLLDAIAVGQFTPGPLLTTATFISYFLGHAKFDLGITGGIVCGTLATIAIFLPSFVLVALFAPVMNRLRQNRIARGALDGMNAAVVALIAVVAVQLANANFRAATSLSVDLLHIAIFVVALVVLLRTKLNATWIIIVAGLIGAVRALV
jgi:chromate transporter